MDALTWLAELHYVQSSHQEFKIQRNNTIHTSYTDSILPILHSSCYRAHDGKGYQRNHFTHVMHITEAQPFCSQVLYFWGQIGWKCFFRVSHWQCVDQPLLKWHAHESPVFSTRNQGKTILSGIISIVLNLRDEFLKCLVSLTTMKNCDIPFWAWSGQWKMIHFICLLPLMMFFAS